MEEVSDIADKVVTCVNSWFRFTTHPKKLSESEKSLKYLFSFKYLSRQLNYLYNIITR